MKNIYNFLVIINFMSVYGERFEDYEHGGANLGYLGTSIFQKPNNISSIKVQSWKEGDDVNPEFLGTYAEGDIVFPTHYYNIFGIVNETRRWPIGVVPYEIDESAFTQKEKSYIFNAMDEFRSKSCIRFLKKEEDDDSWIFIKGEHYGCYTAVGRITGQQIVNLEPPNCLRLGTILHEFMHVLGFGHENARSDRDEFVTIYHKNIEKDREINFGKSFVHQWKHLGSYDVKSLMHYPSQAFSKNGIDTIVAKDHFSYLGRSNYFTEQDIFKIVRLYNCRSKSVRKFSNKIILLLIVLCNTFCLC